MAHIISKAIIETSTKLKTFDIVFIDEKNDEEYSLKVAFER